MLIYDIEILNAIPPRDGRREADINYCQGWGDFQGMGLAVVGCWDYLDERPRVFCQDNLREFKWLLERHDVIVGFNNHRFDDCLLAAHGLEIPAGRSYDLLTEIWYGAGLAGEWRKETHAGYSLDALAQANFARGKTGHGAYAPIAWQRGNIGGVIDYCLMDVHLTKRLLDRVIRAGRLKCPKTGRWLNICKPGGKP